MKELVEFVEYKALPPVFVLRKDRFEYKPQQGWAWLQRLAFRFLARIGCFSYDEKIEYRRHVIDGDDLMRRILEQNEALVRSYHQRGERVLIGAETMAELMHQPRIESAMHFSARYHVGDEIFGMRITVVPYMRGLIVLTKEATA